MPRGLRVPSQSPYRRQSGCSRALEPQMSMMAQGWAENTERCHSSSAGLAVARAFLPNFLGNKGRHEVFLILLGSPAAVFGFALRHELGQRCRLKHRDNLPMLDLAGGAVALGFLYFFRTHGAQVVGERILFLKGF